MYRFALISMLIALVAIISLIAFLSLAPKDDSSPMRHSAVEYVDKEGNRHRLNVRLALTADEQTRGLMDLTDLPQDEGMFFVFGREEQRVFWMKNTLIPLDIIFLNEDIQVVKIHHNTQPNQSQTTYPSEKLSMYVLETNAGWAASVGLSESDQIIWIKF